MSDHKQNDGVEAEQSVQGFDSISRRIIEEAARHHPSQDGISQDGIRNVIEVRGHLTIIKRYDDHKEVVFSENNLIVNGGFTRLASIWGGPDSPFTYFDLKPTYIGVGTDDGTVLPLAVTNTALGAFVYERVIGQRTFLGAPNINGVQFEMTIPKSDASGNTLEEAGLFDNTTPSPQRGLIARVIHSAITKNTSFELTYQWKFTFKAGS